VLIDLYTLILDDSMVIFDIQISSMTSSKNKSYIIHLEQINSVHSKRRKDILMLGFSFVA